MDAQTTYNRITELKEQSKGIHEELDMLLNGFSLDHQDLEFPVQTAEGKEKWFRVYPCEGRFVYNTILEMGVRAKPVKSGI